MSKIKGCGSSNCIANKKKIKYKNTDEFCSKCGKQLVYVCKKCFTPIPENSKGSYCIRCQAERDDRKDNTLDKAKKIGGGVVGVGAMVLSVVPVVNKFIKK